MANTFTYRLILFIALFIIRSFTSQGNDGSIHHRYRTIVVDTVPPTQNPPEEVPEKTKPDIIKEVPKSRKQVKPMAIPTLPVKPIKIIKPKIIKRIGIIG